MKNLRTSEPRNFKLLLTSVLLFFALALQAQNWTPSGANFTLSNANGTIGTTTNHSLDFRTNNLSRLRIHSNGSIGIGGINNAQRLMQLHGTGPILAEMGSPIPPPAGSESMLVITNTESGSTAWDGLRLGLQGNVASLGTVDKLRMDVFNGPALLSFREDGRITMFTSAFSYDAKFAIRSVGENALFIDNSNNTNGYGVRVQVSQNNVDAYSVTSGVNNSRFVVKGDGRVGVNTGTIGAGFILDVNGRTRTQNIEVQKIAGSVPLVVKDATTTQLIVTSEGVVGVGTANPSTDYLLDVAGKLRACEVRVNNPGWCDFVFEPDYKLLPLGELKTFIKENKHLPEMPSEKQVIEAGGIDLAQMNAALLQRSEENTLYIIALEEKINRLSSIVDAQTKLLEKLTNSTKSDE